MKIVYFLAYKGTKGMHFVVVMLCLCNLLLIRTNQLHIHSIGSPQAV